MKSSRNPQTKYLRIEKTLKAKIVKNGFIQEDERLMRKTRSMPGEFLVLKDSDVLNWLKGRKPLDKYRADMIRMQPSFNDLIRFAVADINSRRLVSFNTVEYLRDFECFLLAHFVWTHRKEFDLYIYQRSSDIRKLLDDVTFFAFLAKKFEDRVHKKVTKIVVIFGHIHIPL